MKLSTFAIAIVMAGVVGVASAGQPETLPTVSVHASPLSQCTVPTDQAGHACDAFDQLVRANFTPREIGMLFGYRTSYPEYRTGGVDRLQRRYQAVVQQYVTMQQAAAKAAPVAIR